MRSIQKNWTRKKLKYSLLLAVLSRNRLDPKSLTPMYSEGEFERGEKSHPAGC